MMVILIAMEVLLTMVLVAIAVVAPPKTSDLTVAAVCHVFDPFTCNSASALVCYAPLVGK